MRFIGLIIAVLSPFLWGAAPVKNTQQTLRTHIPLNTQKGCAVRVNVWLSPSCTHCSEYFAHDIPKITALPGFCVDLHFLPNLYLLDMPVAVLIWSQGPDNAYKIAELFFKNQSKWLDKSTSKEDDPKRAQDIEEYLQEIKADTSKVVKVKNYLVASDPFLYVKIFALSYFSIEHLEKYLPKGDTTLNSIISLTLMKDLPRKEGSVVNFSPAFTDTTGQLLPDSQLKYGILTPSAAEDILKAVAPVAGQSVSPPIAAPVTSTPTPVTPIAPALPKVAEKAQIDVEDDRDVQDADDELDRTLENLDKNSHDEDHRAAVQPTKKRKKPASPNDDKHVLKIPQKSAAKPQKPSPYDDSFEEEHDESSGHLPDDETTKQSKELENVLHRALQGLDVGPEGHEDPIDHLVN